MSGISHPDWAQKLHEDASLRLAAIIESSDDAIISKDLTGTITSWNNGAERIYGYTAAEAVGQPVSMLTAPDRLDEMPEILAKIKQGHQIKHYETRRRTKDGRVIDVALTVSPIRDGAGNIVGASKIARDITERKRDERERALLLAREREARRTAELLNSVAHRLAAELDIEKLVQEITGTARELIGAELGSFFQNTVNEKSESKIGSALAAAPEEPASFPARADSELFAPTFRGETVFRCDDITQDPRYGQNSPENGMLNGQPLVRSYLAAPVVARSGEVLGGLFFGHSGPGRFTEMHEAIVSGIAAQGAIAMDNARLFEQAQWAQVELKRSNEELRRANQDLEIFAYSASHDLQEPIRTIAISAQLIERYEGQRLQGKTAAFLANILAASRRMGVLIEDLLSYTRATKYEEGPPPNADAARVFANVLESLQGAIVESEAKVTVSELPVVVIHENRLAQLLQNLISNALKYRSKESPKVHVTASERDGWCVFSVVDNGIGIDAQYADQIFGLFIVDPGIRTRQ